MQFNRTIIITYNYICYIYESSSHPLFKPKKKPIHLCPATFPHHFCLIIVWPRYDHLKHILRIKSRFVLPFDCRYCEAYRSWADIDVTLALGKGKAPGEVGEFNEIQLSKKKSPKRQLKEGRNMQVESLQVKMLTVQVFNRSFLWKDPWNWTTNTPPSIQPSVWHVLDPRNCHQLFSAFGLES